MSQRAASKDAFVPFEPLSALGGNAGAASRPASSPPGLKIVPKADPAAAAFAPLAAASAMHAHQHSAPGGKPNVILQREGERVTGIRIECPCGQVIELSCSY